MSNLSRKTPLKRKPWLRKDGTPKQGFTKSGKSKVSTVKRRIDKLMGFVVKHEASCFACGVNGWKCSDRLETCHIVRRGAAAIFADPLNLVAMCNVHHRYFTAHEAEWKEFVESKFPGRYDYLRKLAREHKESGKKVDWADWESYWKKKKEALL